jgi:hypothetical protein
VRDLLRHDLAHEARIVIEHIGEREHDRVLDHRAVGCKRRHAGNFVGQVDHARVTAKYRLDMRHRSGVLIGNDDVERAVDLLHARDGLLPRGVIDVPTRNDGGLTHHRRGVRRGIVVTGTQRHSVTVEIDRSALRLRRARRGQRLAREDVSLRVWFRADYPGHQDDRDQQAVHHSRQLATSRFVPRTRREIAALSCTVETDVAMDNGSAVSVAYG